MTFNSLAFFSPSSVDTCLIFINAVLVIQMNMTCMQHTSCPEDQSYYRPALWLRRYPFLSWHHLSISMSDGKNWHLVMQCDKWLIVGQVDCHVSTLNTRLTRDVINNNSDSRVTDVTGDQTSKPFLTCRIPQLESDLSCIKGQKWMGRHV